MSRALGRTDLTTQEQANVRTALQFLRLQCGGVKPLTMALRALPSNSGPAGIHWAKPVSGVGASK